MFSVSFRESEASREPALSAAERESRRYPCPDDEISCGHSGYSAPLALAFGEGSVEMTSLREHAKQVRSPDPPRNGENGLSSAVGAETHRAECAAHEVAP